MSNIDTLIEYVLNECPHSLGDSHLCRQCSYRIADTLGNLRKALQPFANKVHGDGVDAPYPSEKWIPILSAAKEAIQ